jgi:Protein of unknown function (DUF3619)
MTPQSNEPWVDRAVALLDESAQALDGATLSRLNRARQAALAERRSPVRGWTLGASLAGAALAVAFAFGIVRHTAPVTPADPFVAGQSVDADELTADDNPDLYENLDFYAWLDAQQQDGNG